MATDNLQSNNCSSCSDCHTVGPQPSLGLEVHTLLTFLLRSATLCYKLSLVLKVQKF